VQRGGPSDTTRARLWRYEQVCRPQGACRPRVTDAPDMVRHRLTLSHSHCQGPRLCAVALVATTNDYHSPVRLTSADAAAPRASRRFSHPHIVLPAALAPTPSTPRPRLRQLQLQRKVGTAVNSGLGRTSSHNYIVAVAICNNPPYSGCSSAPTPSSGADPVPRGYRSRRCRPGLLPCVTRRGPLLLVQFSRTAKRRIVPGLAWLPTVGANGDGGRDVIPPRTSGLAAASSSRRHPRPPDSVLSVDAREESFAAASMTVPASTQQTPSQRVLSPSRHRLQAAAASLLPAPHSKPRPPEHTLGPAGDTWRSNSNYSGAPHGTSGPRFSPLGTLGWEEAPRYEGGGGPNELRGKDWERRLRERDEALAEAEVRLEQMAGKHERAAAERDQALAAR